MSETPREDATKVIRFIQETVDIHGGDGSKLFKLLKKAVLDVAEEIDLAKTDTNSSISVGVKPPLIDKLMARELRDFNATHAICVDAKKASSVGLGHRNQKIHEVLDPLCRFSWQDTLDALADDYWETGECFLEVVFGDPDDRTIVTGLYHLESAQVHVEVEEQDNSERYHYIVEGETGDSASLVMAKWGDLEDLKQRFGVVEDGETEGELGEDELPPEATRTANEVIQRSDRSGTLAGSIVNSEIIHIRQSTNRSRYYGYPDYMSAVPSIELVQCMTQHEFDFYFNRGVPEFLMFLIGKNIGNCWEKVEETFKASQGIGNSHKTAAFHIPGSAEEVAVQVEKLAMEDAANSGFSEKSSTLDMRIATAHGMPPQLANIALPGKIGAANEGPNAMLTFQMRKLGQAQKNFSRMLAITLGSQDISLSQPTGSPVKLTADQFLGKSAKPMSDDGVPQFVQPGNGFNTILDGMTLGAQNTMASMKEPLAGSGRDPDDGLLDGARDRKPGDPKQTRGPGTGQ